MKPFILASASPRRRDLLAQIGLTPERIIPADINEDPIPDELPRPHALRLACEKAQKVALDNPNIVVLASDTVVGVGRRILPKTEDVKSAEECLRLLSGRSHRVFTGVAVMAKRAAMAFKASQVRSSIIFLALTQVSLVYLFTKRKLF